jgi:hypothetical protein
VELISKINLYVNLQAFKRIKLGFSTEIFKAKDEVIFNDKDFRPQENILHKVNLFFFQECL